MSNPLYWAFNLPLQIWPSDDGLSAMVLNYMPRKECVTHLQLSDVMEGQTREEFFERAALILENLARQMRAAKTDAKLLVYYPDEGMEPRP